MYEVHRQADAIWKSYSSVKCTAHQMAVKCGFLWKYDSTTFGNMIPPPFEIGFPTLGNTIPHLWKYDFPTRDWPPLASFCRLGVNISRPPPIPHYSTAVWSEESAQFFQLVVAWDSFTFGIFRGTLQTSSSEFSSVWRAHFFQPLTLASALAYNSAPP